MLTITINIDENNAQHKSRVSRVLNADIVEGLLFNDFVESQKKGQKPDGTFKRKGLSSEGVVNLREETCDILSHCNPHNAVSNLETTHLVVGYVQSGKTMSFTGLTALAKDNGYRMVVYLAGSTKNLLQQTSRRLKKDLIGKDNRNRDSYSIHIDPTENDIDDIVGHLSKSSHPIILIPTLKHYIHINKLAGIFESSTFKEVMENETVLIVDDEADQVSLNSYGRANSHKDENGDTPEEKESKTYESILRMRASLSGNSYIQYTATPQANLLISMQDLLSPKSHTLLTPGEGYIGGKKFFGMDGGTNHDLFHGQLIREIPEGEVFHKKHNPLKKIPQSLKDALLMHVLAVAIVVHYRKVEDITFLSMMVHPDETKKWNKIFKEWIDKQRNRWRKDIVKPEGDDDREELFIRLRHLFPEVVRLYEDYERPEFGDIIGYIPDILNDWKTYLVNSDEDAQTDIPWDDYSMHVLVGAQMLNRGFTVENLVTTYMPRYTTGATNADTIEQRCRFFGYKEDYIKSCRVFLPAKSIADYKNYVKHEEELRATLNECDTLAEAEHRILLSPSLKPTRMNVLPESIVSKKLSGMCEMQAFDNRVVIEDNDKVVKNFIDLYQARFKEDFINSTAMRTHRSMKLSFDDAISFLSDFHFKNVKEVRQKANTIRYLRYMSSSDLTEDKYVRFIQMAWRVESKERDFDFTKKRLTGNVFEGPSSAQDSTDYVGDRNIVDKNAITIQLHHIKFKNRELNFPETAYAIAIYYPEKLAISYCTNEIDAEEDDEE